MGNKIKMALLQRWYEFLYVVLIKIGLPVLGFIAFLLYGLAVLFLATIAFIIKGIPGLIQIGINEVRNKLKA